MQAPWSLITQCHVSSSSIAQPRYAGLKTRPHHSELLKTRIAIEKVAIPLAGDFEYCDGQAFDCGRQGNGAWGYALSPVPQACKLAILTACLLLDHRRTKRALRASACITCRNWQRQAAVSLLVLASQGKMVDRTGSAHRKWMNQKNARLPTGSDMRQYLVWFWFSFVAPSFRIYCIVHIHRF